MLPIILPCIAEGRMLNTIGVFEDRDAGVSVNSSIRYGWFVLVSSAVALIIILPHKKIVHVDNKKLLDEYFFHIKTILFFCKKCK